MASTSIQATLPLFEEANDVPASWSLVHEPYFFELMLDKVQLYGENRQSGTLSKHHWTDIRKQYYTWFKLKHDLKDPILCIVDASNKWWYDHVKDSGFSSSDGDDETNMLESEIHTSSPMPPFDSNIHNFPANNVVVADENEGNINNQFCRRSRTSSGNNRSTPIF
ncbi:hypothetical protein MKX01_026417, partial [Papaver californicum]